jgi:rubrerythrin
MAEAAYRAAVQKGGKNQQKLTVGWEVLGLARDAAARIFAEEAKEGFVDQRVAMYGGQTRRYDKYGNTLLPGEEADDAKKTEEEAAPISNVYECGECGYTLFIAKGRESKFFGEGFRCPDCGAPKDKFNARDDIEE